MPKTLISMRVSDKTIIQINTLAKDWGMNKTEVVASAVNLLYQQEMRDRKASAKQREQKEVDDDAES